MTTVSPRIWREHTSFRCHLWPLYLLAQDRCILCLASGSNSPLIHSQYGPQSARSLIIYFPLENTLPRSLSSVLLKCNGKQNPSLPLSDGEEKNNFKGFATVCNPWLHVEKTLRGLRWDRPPNQSLPPEDSSHWCRCWLTDLKSSQWLSNRANLDHLLRQSSLYVPLRWG